MERNCEGLVAWASLGMRVMKVAFKVGRIPNILRDSETRAHTSILTMGQQ
jgi:hypothetical protein